MELKKSLLQLALISIASLGLPAAADPFTFRSQVNIPGSISNGTAVAQFTSDFLGPDALKISPITEAVTGWWHFDAVDENLEGTVDVFFYYTPSLAVNASTVSISLSVHFANGTGFDADAVAESAVITTDGNVSCGEFEGTGVGWTGTRDKEQYEVKINSPELGVTGTILIESVCLPQRSSELAVGLLTSIQIAPGHYPCSPIRAGESMAIAPKFGFSNAIPDGNAKVDLVLNGSSLTFTGIGYHDQVRNVVPHVHIYVSANPIHPEVDSCQFPRELSLLVSRPCAPWALFYCLVRWISTRREESDY